MYDAIWQLENLVLTHQLTLLQFPGSIILAHQFCPCLKNQDSMVLFSDKTFCLLMTIKELAASHNKYETNLSQTK